jgi:hypothetical protein
LLWTQNGVCGAAAGLPLAGFWADGRNTSAGSDACCAERTIVPSSVTSRSPFAARRAKSCGGGSTLAR